MNFVFLKFLCIILNLIVLSLPFFPRKFGFSLASMSYEKKESWKNILFVAETAFLSGIMLSLAALLKKAYLWFFNLNFMLRLIDGASVRKNYLTEVLVIILSNITICMIFFIVKSVFRKFLDEKVFESGGNNSNKKNSKGNQKKVVADEIDKSEKRLRLLRKKSVLVFGDKESSEDDVVVAEDYLSEKRTFRKDISKDDKEDDEIPKGFQECFKYVLKKCVSIFYKEEQDQEYVKTSTFRWAKELQLFLVMVGLFYAVVFVVMQLPVVFVFEDSSWVNKAAMWLINNTYMYPMLSLVFLFELSLFLDGEYKEPDKADKLQVSVFSRGKENRETDYAALKETLLNKYNSKYNIKNFDASVMAGKSAYNIAEKGIAIQNIAKSIRSAKGFVNADYMQSIDYMLDGKHVLFDSALYSALGEYIVYYLFIILSFGKRSLFICKDQKEIANAMAYLEAEFKRITKTPNIFWRFSTFEKLHEGKNPDILFLTPEEFLEKGLFTDGKDFFDELTDVFVLDADKILGANNYYCLIIAKKLAKATSENFESNSAAGLRYSFFSNGHIQAINNSLKQFFDLGDSPLEVFHSFGLASKTDVFVWHTGLASMVYVDNGANQVALEVQIAKDSGNFGVSNISLISDSAVYSSQINEIPGMLLNKCDLSDNPVGYVVVADDCFNLPNAIYNYSRFSGRKSSVLHVVSKPYLLRDYFTAKAEDYVSHFELIGQTMSEHAEAVRANVILLLCDAVNGIDREEFINRATEIFGPIINADSMDFESCIKICYKAAFDTAADYEPKYTIEKTVNAEHEFKTLIFIKDSDKMFERLLETTRTVRIEYSNSQEVENTDVFKNEIVQHFIPGQVITRNNHSYTIKDVFVDRGVITLDDTGPSINVPSDYIQTRIYDINSAELVNRFGHSYRTKNSIVTKLGMNVYDIEAEVDTVGYYSIEEAVQTVDLVKPNFAKYVYIGDDEELAERIKRCIKTKMLVLELDMETQTTPHATYLLSVMLHEFMKTLFPYQYRCISVCPVFEEGFNEDEFFADETAIRDLYPRIKGDLFKEAKAESTEDEEAELTEEAEVQEQKKDTSKLRIAIIEDIQGGNGVVETLVDGNGIMVTNLLHVVSDFLTWLKTAEGQKCTYLNFGYDTLPAVFDAVNLEKIVKQFRHEIERSELVRIRDKSSCFFCRCSLDSAESIELEDGRTICEKCCEDTVNTFEKLEECLGDVLSAIKAGTSVPDTIPEDITVDFVSTEDIRKRYQDKKEIPLGYCNHAKKRIYIEYGLPKTAVYSIISHMITQLWQDANILNDGSEIFDAHPVFVELQVLKALKMSAEHDALKNLNEDNEALNELRTLLEEAGNQDSFAYFLGAVGKQTGGTDSDDDDDISFIAERDPASLPRFYVNCLSDSEKAVYDQIFNAISEFKESTGPLVSEINDDRCSDILNMVMMDNPNIFWCANPPGVLSVDSSGMVKNVIFKYCMDKSAAQSRNKKIEKTVKGFVSGIKESMSDYEVALRAHENIIKLIDYDSIGLDLQKKDSDRFDKPDNLRSIYGVFVEKKAVCAGYARAYQYLLNRMGIECAYVKGPCPDGVWHAWNIVKLEGDYYYVDVTFDDSSNTDERKNVSAEISYDYFCITTEELLKSRSIHKAGMYPECTATKCNYFVRSKRYFKEYDAQKISKVIESDIKSGKTEIALRAENDKVLKVILNRLIDNRGIDDILGSIEDGKSQTFTSHYVNKDLNILHLFVK